jgi:nucleoside-diphosphate-sugar epimerase
MIEKQERIVIAGAAGLVGQNLAVLLQERGYTNLVGIDKHPHNTRVLKELHPDMEIIEADLATAGAWGDAFAGARAVVMLQAQIGGEDYSAFEANNVVSTGRVIEACRQHGVGYIVHISSSVVNSAARDFYTETKKAQEKLILASGIPSVVLRPTLMFGWFDRKHLGWLSRFMQSIPVFPIPGSGRYMRQPLYNLDFCRIIESCIARETSGQIYNISGMDEIDYVDMIREIKSAVGSEALILHIPYVLFAFLLKLWALFDRDPPFTTKQLRALVTPDRFEVIPWDKIFGVPATPFRDAIRETFTHPRYADVLLKF